MGAFQWLMKKVMKVFSRTTNSLFYTLLYREILKETHEITKNEDDSVTIFREFGKRSAYESCERHSSIFKFMPGNPEKILEYFEVLWAVVFGMEMGEHTYEEIKAEGQKYTEFLLTIKNNPICGGYGDDDEDTFKFRKLSKDTEGCSSGLGGMLESVANFILKIKENDYRINITETKCLAKGADALELSCKIYDLVEWQEVTAVKLQDKLKSHVHIIDSTGEEEFVQDSKLDFLDKLQDVISLDKLEDLLDEPLEGIKKKLAEVIRDKLNMEPDHFFDYFRNYEDDMIRILGFLSIHLLNEYGGLIEKLLKNETISKAIGYLFNQIKDMALLFIPLDVVNDYHQLLIDFLDGLAPPEMVDNVRKMSGKDDLNLIIEGAQMALENLGINFSELKGNIWEELKKEREDGLISSDASMVEETQEKFPKIIQIIQELLMMISEVLTLPTRVLVSESHHGIKTTINSVISEEEGGLFVRFRDRLDTIFDIVQEMRE